MRTFQILSVPILLLLGLPIVALLISSSPSEIIAGVKHPHFLSAIWLSLRTSAVAMIVIVLFGTPLAWWMARRGSRFFELFIYLPIVLPPAVIGVALLQAFGRGGLFGTSIPFTAAAVILAQTVVGAPFYIQSASSAFRRVDEDLLLVARTLGSTPMKAFFRVGLPLALPGILAGVALAWARALGEFGATLIFAGNLPGTTQTMPLAIYMSLESDVRAAIALSLVLCAVSTLLLFAMRAGIPAGKS